MYEGINSVKYLGLRVKDKITGFKGVVTSVAFDLYGCVQVIINPGLKSNGELGDQTWFDTNRIEILSSDRVMDLPDSIKAKPLKEKLKSIVKGPENKNSYTRG